MNKKIKIALTVGMAAIVVGATTIGSLALGRNNIFSANATGIEHSVILNDLTDEDSKKDWTPTGTSYVVSGSWTGVTEAVGNDFTMATGNLNFGIGGTITKITFDRVVTGNNAVIDIWGKHTSDPGETLCYRSNKSKGTYSETITCTSTSISSTWGEENGKTLFGFKYFRFKIWQAAGESNNKISNLTVYWTC